MKTTQDAYKKIPFTVKKKININIKLYIGDFN